MLDMNTTKLLSQEMSNRQMQPLINFESISNKLADNSYQSAKEWVDEVNSIWISEQQYYDKNSHYYEIVKFLQKWFEKKVSSIPATEMDAWMIDYKKVQRRLKKLSKLNTPS